MYTPHKIQPPSCCREKRNSHLIGNCTSFQFMFKEKKIFSDCLYREIVLNSDIFNPNACPLLTLYLGVLENCTLGYQTESHSVE